MFQAEVLKAFRYDEVTASPAFEVALGLAPAEGARVTKRYRKGQIVTLATGDDYREFRRLAALYGGSVRCVGLPPR